MSADERRQLPSVDASDIERRAAKGGAITAGAQVVRGVIEAIGSLLLARTLSPADFGLVDMIVAVTGIIDMLKDFGLSTATIQKEHIEHAQVSVLFWINLAIGVALTLITLAVAPFIALGYARPELLQLTLALSFSTLLGALAVQHQALLRRNLKFKSLAYIDVLSSSAGTACALVAAFKHWGPWALVVRQLVRLALQAALTWLFCPWRPTRPRRANVRELLIFGSHLSGFQVINYLERNLDNVLVGRFAGAQALGFYAKAYDLMRLPVNQVNAPVASVAVPALSRLAAFPERYLNLYRGVTRLLLLITVPLAPLAIFTADWFIPALLGPQWKGSVIIFQWLALTLLIKPLANTTGWLFISQARTQELWRWAVVGGVIAIVSFVVGLRWGALGVAIAYTLADICIRTPILLWWVGRTGPVGTRDLIACLWPAWTCALFVGLTYWLIDARITQLGAGLRVAICAPASLLVGYLAVVATPWGRSALADGVRMLRSLRKPEPPENAAS